ncbi:hypothetical protein FB559_2960 [Actinoallomurus bryophytorum]|uniref:Uncharacterized protein n=1 Tax=Actinoallomurus bryophytorum TaxID=1490222 RepID=A0A543CK08_9ACTN|nr:hypothetical protein FB559_2960 [Actinoallomurus bryophytorum]
MTMRQTPRARAPEGPSRRLRECSERGCSERGCSEHGCSEHGCSEHGCSERKRGEHKRGERKLTGRHTSPAAEARASKQKISQPSTHSTHLAPHNTRPPSGSPDRPRAEEPPKAPEDARASEEVAARRDRPGQGSGNGRHDRPRPSSERPTQPPQKTENQQLNPQEEGSDTNSRNAAARSRSVITYHGNEATPAGGESGGRPGRSGSGGVEPVPFFRGSPLVNLKRGPGHRQQERIPGVPSVCRFDICCPIAERCVEWWSFSGTTDAIASVSHIRTYAT